MIITECFFILVPFKICIIILGLLPPRTGFITLKNLKKY